MVTNNAVNMTQMGQVMYSGDGIWTQGAQLNWYNLGISYSAGTFTVLGSDGTSLSSSNPAYVTLPSKASPGLLKTVKVTANQTFSDGSAGTIDNARFGLITGVNWLQDIPFFLYAVMDDTETLINFMISRNPAARISPVSTSISKTGAIINVNQSDFFSLGNITVTSYDSNPCLCVGAFRMQFTGSTDSWTVTTLTSEDGIGRFMEAHEFSLPSGVNGAAANTYIISNPGTEPQWTNNDMKYRIGRDGYVDYRFMGGIASVAGVGLNDLQPILPYAFSGMQYVVDGKKYTNSTDTSLGTQCAIDTGNSFFTSISIASSTGVLPNSGIALNDNLQMYCRYPAYLSN